jgi:recombination protein RecA
MAEETSEAPSTKAAPPKKGAASKGKKVVASKVATGDEASKLLGELVSGANKGLKEGERGTAVVFGTEAANEFLNSKFNISTGIKGLDAIIGEGGYGTGRVSEIFGPKSSGKSELTQKTAAQFLQDFPQGIVIYYDQERALDDKKLASRPIFMGERMAIMWAPTAEKLFKQVEKILVKIYESKKDIPVLIIVDSVAALLSEAEADKELDEATVAELARLMSKMFRKINPILPKTNAHLMLINQIRHKIGGTGYGDKYDTPGGEATRFYADYRISVDRFSSYWVSDSGKTKGKLHPDGQRVIFQTVKNKRVPPMRSVIIPLLYSDIQGEQGLSDVWGVWELLKSRKILVHKSKGNYYLTTESDKPVDDRRKFTMLNWKEAYSDEAFWPYIQAGLNKWEDWAMKTNSLSISADADDDDDDDDDDD